MSSGRKYIQVVLAMLMAVLTGLFAQLRFSLGPIPYTMQNAGVVMAGLLLSPKYSLISMGIYMTLVAVGLPLASGFRGGIAVLLGYTGGYIAGFTLSASLMSVLSKAYLRLRGRGLGSIRLRDVLVLWLVSIVSAVPTYVLGFAVFAYHALGSERLLNWVKESAVYLGVGGLDELATVFLISVAIFLPQDAFMDHVAGIVLAKEVVRLLRHYGVDLA